MCKAFIAPLVPAVISAIFLYAFQLPLSASVAVGAKNNTGNVYTPDRTDSANSTALPQRIFCNATGIQNGSLSVELHSNSSSIMPPVRDCDLNGNSSEPSGRMINAAMNIFNALVTNPIVEVSKAIVGTGVGFFFEGMNMFNLLAIGPSSQQRNRIMSSIVAEPFLGAGSIKPPIMRSSGSGGESQAWGRAVTSRKPHPPPPFVQAELRTLEKAAVRYLNMMEANLSLSCNADAKYQYMTKLGVQTETEDETDTEKDEEEEQDIHEKVSGEILKKFVHWKQFSPELVNEISLLIREADLLVDPMINEEAQNISETMKAAYKAASVCPFENRNCSCLAEVSECLKVEPGIEKILASSKNPEELQYYWEEWHNAVGQAISPESFLRFIDLRNQIAQAKGFKDEADFWLADYNDWTPSWTAEQFKATIKQLWNEIQPYYKILHAYVRMKLSQQPAFKPLIKRCGYIPAHLTGNMFGQSWAGIQDRIKPFPDAPSVDASEAMKKKKYSPKKMIELANQFYISLGLDPLPPAFWKHSVYVKKPGSKQDCHPSALDMCLGRAGRDYRLAMCAEVNQVDFATMHHELGHIQYMMQFRRLRKPLRDASNPGFDESIGDVMSMSATTPEHLQCFLKLDLGLGIECNKSPRNFTVTETDYNFLFSVALDSLSFFPFSLSMDYWRWELIDKTVSLTNFNDRWWEIRKNLQGIIPPGKRPNHFFDAAAKYHVVGHRSYLSYFLSTIFQYDFNEALCKAADQYNPNDPKGKPIYKCDITGSKRAGTLLKKVLQLGRKRPWPEALEAITGRRDISTQPLLNYLYPLFPKLVEQIKANGEYDCLLLENWAE